MSRFRPRVPHKTPHAMTRRPPFPPSPRRGHDMLGFALAVAIPVGIWLVWRGLVWLVG